MAVTGCRRRGSFGGSVTLCGAMTGLAVLGLLPWLLTSSDAAPPPKQVRSCPLLVPRALFPPGEQRHDQDVPGGGAVQVPHHAALPVRQPAALRVGGGGEGGGRAGQGREGERGQRAKAASGGGEEGAWGRGTREADAERVGQQGQQDGTARGGAGYRESAGRRAGWQVWVGGELGWCEVGAPLVEQRNKCLGWLPERRRGLLGLAGCGCGLLEGGRWAGGA